VAILQRLRVKQIRFTACLLSAVEALPGGGRLIQPLANWPITAPVLNAFLGYQRVFDDLPQALAAAELYSSGGHDAPGFGALHLRLSQSPRPSDYAAFHHIQGPISRWFEIFDLGGNVGNLFYCYKRYLHLPPHLVLQVYDLPKRTEEGGALLRKMVKSSFSLQETGRTHPERIFCLSPARFIFSIRPFITW
jgi:hypothetical protein